VSFLLCLRWLNDPELEETRYSAEKIPTEETGKMNSSSNLINALFIFVLAGFIGFEVIRRVSPLLHTPLMSLTNALDAIAVVGAIVLVGEHKTTLSAVFGFIAVVAATSNIVGGFLITDRMLKMFKSSRPAAKSAADSVTK
jgi:H+-translocating NAD(P) transhydrogenase subunit alpha